MLRITVRCLPRDLTFQLEGKMAEPWLREFERSWKNFRARRRKRVRVDLTGVTFIDAAGRACLATLHRQGAELVAADCLTKAVVAEIADSRSSNGNCEHSSRRNNGPT